MRSRTAALRAPSSASALARPGVMRLTDASARASIDPRKISTPTATSSATTDLRRYHLHPVGHNGGRGRQETGDRKPETGNRRPETTEPTARLQFSVSGLLFPVARLSTALTERR